MRVTTKGQVTIPQHIREKLGITPSTEVDFVEEEGRVFLVKQKGEKSCDPQICKITWRCNRQNDDR